ncbi:MFS transporter [Actinokineospora sp. 24-640]
MIRSGSPDQPERRPKRGRKGWTDAPQPDWRAAEPPPRRRPTRPYERPDEPDLETFGDRYPHDYPQGGPHGEPSAGGSQRPRPPWRDDDFADRYDRGPAPRDTRRWGAAPRHDDRHPGHPSEPRPRHPDDRHPDDRHPDDRYPGGHPDSRHPDSRHPDDRYPDDRHPDDRYPGGHPDSRHPDSRHPDDRYSGSRPDERHADGRDAGSRHPSDRYPDSRHPDSRQTSGRHPDSRRSDERYADRRHPDERYGDGRHTDERYADGRHPDDGYRDDGYRDGTRDRDDRFRDGPYRDNPRGDGPHRGGTDGDPSERATDEVPGSPRFPKKLTVTRVAALRSRQLTTRAVSAFRRAAGADGAEKSGLTALTYATMFNYASDAAMAVALANTLFFSAAAGESKGKVALYLLITVAPFALLAPVIGPALDRIQRGRRLAMCAVSAGQALMCVIMALNFDNWMLYPAALGKMVLSKSFTVLKAAVTPRVLPPEITLAKTNARLTVFGLAAGAVLGGVAVGFANVFGSAGALWFTVVISLAGAVQALRIPARVEVTEGEVPASIKAHPGKAHRQPVGRQIVVALWGNGTIRVLTGFLMMFAAFAVRAEYETDAFQQILLLGVIAAAAGIGSFAGNAIGARVHVGKPEQVVIGCATGALVSTVVATFAAGITTAAIVGLVGAVSSALAKNSLDAVIQDDLPEQSRASAFGRSETVLQLAWVFGGAMGVLLPPTWWIGFLVVSVVLAVGLAQTLMTRRGGSLIPGLGGDRPIRPDPTADHPLPDPRGWRPATLHEGPPPGSP